MLVTQWNARFFNALEARNWAAFGDELIMFCFIACAAIAVGMSQYFFGQTLQIRWRRWLTENYASVWMADGRHYRVRFVDSTIDNIHLRIANDVYLFIQRTHELGTGLLGSLVALFSFAYILWGLSADHAAAAVRRRPGVSRLSDLGGADLCRNRHSGRALDRLAADHAQFQPAALRIRFSVRHRARRPTIPSRWR